MTHETTERLAVFLATEHDAVSNSPGGCPDENVWAQLETGLLSGHQRDDLMVHARACGPCRRRMSMIVAEWGQDISIEETTTAEQPSLIFRIRPAVYALAACIAVAVTATLVFRPSTGSDVDGVLGAPIARLTDTGRIGIVQRRTLATDTAPVDQPKITALIADLHQQTKKDPNNAMLWHNLGRAQEKAAQFNAARASYQRAATLAPDNGTIQNALGVRLFLNNQYADALAAFEKAIAADAEDADAHLNAALTLEELDRVDEAIRHWKRFLELAPDDPQADEVRQWLTILEKPSGQP